jgi:hypothetical protein
VLVVAADGEVRVAVHRALGRRQLAHHQFQQCALPRAVGPHQCYSRVAVDAKLQVLVQVVLLLACAAANTLVLVRFER